jgi:hypothetical protein
MNDDKYTETKIVDGKVQLKGASINYPYPKQYIIAAKKAARLAPQEVSRIQELRDIQPSIQGRERTEAEQAEFLDLEAQEIAFLPGSDKVFWTR